MPDSDALLPQARALRLPDPRWGLLTAMLVCTLVYWPGLSGGFLFDDFPNIVDNAAVHVTSLNPAKWKDAALASPSTELRRPLAMLSFAVNEYFTGDAPLPMKATNLAIHLLNGVLLFLALARLLGSYARVRAASGSAQWLACGISAAWLLLPINLTGVIYVVQRMESLAQTFVLFGLWQYFTARHKQIAGLRGSLRAAAALILGTSMGLLFKESAVLLPLYALLAEWIIFRFKFHEPDDRKRLILLYLLVLVLPGIVGLTFLLPRVFAESAYASRPFTMAQRLLTEPRLLFDYLHWTLFPSVRDLGFYHDDISTSISPLQPASALASMLMLGALIAFGVFASRRAPLLALGIFWFLSAHLLTATVIPLELVYEHRNYFASIGVLLAAAAIILKLTETRQPLRVVIAILTCGLYATVTASRAYDWGDPIRFAEAEAEHHPQSPRAQYELGRVLVIATDYKAGSPLVKPAYEVLDRARLLPHSSALAESAMILMASQLHQPLNPDWWRSMTQKLAENPISEEDVSALKSLTSCQNNGNCSLPKSELLNAFLAALSHEPVNSRLLAEYSDFIGDNLHDYALSERLLREALTKTPEQAGMRIALVSTLLKEGKKKDAAAEVEILERSRLDKFETLQLEKLQKAIR